ncbi:MAG: hypothetical protein IPK19_33080 [Chloroflexi bacterium]|nr:hypothetical protein [Chloroflexota bacterium]
MSLLRRAIGILLVLSIFAVGPAGAQDRSLVWKRWDVLISSVDTTENFFRVTEFYDVQFSSP